MILLVLFTVYRLPTPDSNLVLFIILSKQPGPQLTVPFFEKCWLHYCLMICFSSQPGAAGSDVKPGKHLSLLLAGADDWASKRLKRDTTTV